MSNIIIYPIEEQNKITKNPINIGIDLGTTYTLMATVDAANVNFNKTNQIPVQFVRFPQFSPFEFDQTIEDEKIASIVAFYKGKPYVGNNLYHLKGHPEFQYKKNIFYHWKVEMGVDHHPLYPNAINEKLDMPYKIAGGIMNYMRKTYSQGNDYELANTIITVPASFQANQRKDTLKAAKMAKISTNDTMLIDEPNAAFLGYFNRLVDSEKERWSKEVKNKNVLVIDFGGGTLDLSLLNVDFRRDTGITISNRAISRYNDLGGQDIDLLIAEEHLLPKVIKTIPNFDSLDISDVKNTILPQLIVMAEDLKITVCNAMSLKVGSGDISNLNLSEIIATRLDNILVLNNNSYDLGELKLTAEKFKELFVKFFRGKQYKFKYFDKAITTISTSISEIIEKSNETLDAVDFVLLVGGSSFNPLLGALTQEKLINAQLLVSPEPDKLVAEGAGVYSFFVNQYGISLISPITSDNLGVRLKGNRFYPIIERGQSLPQIVNIPDFKLQTNLLSEVIVPVCINGADFSIGEIRCSLNKFYDIDTIIKIEAEITQDKVFKMQVIADDEIIGNAKFENPYAIGKLTEEQLEVFEAQSNLNKAQQARNTSEEKRFLKTLIDKHFKANNYLGALENAEVYIKRFDDQDSWIWNMKYILNSRLGRLGAAKKALERAIEINPTEPAWRHNYAVLLEKTDAKAALEYLEMQAEDIKEETTIRCKIALLKNEVNKDTTELQKIVKDYKNNPAGFSQFDKRVLLNDIFGQVDEPYAYIDPKTKRRKEDEGKYLDMNNLPF
ncbi:Hsp70 family protein [Mesonia ostreae]|uniref:Hsp70 family protein n=1 Tax=Mesonia ostreae TaxID=861110 RepID=A0ABU2KFS9_9FLAO|nr:Hsp70 family protein [Mesonia ostreae]MDT0293529.1 Hsp70 family protein [Mesonia ostreae]